MESYYVNKERFRNDDLLYCDLHEEDQGRDLSSDVMKVFEVPYCAGSDYSGSTIEHCNHNTFLELTKENDWKGVRSCPGGYGTYCIVISEPASLNPEIVELLQNLETYPVIDQDALFEHEMEVKQEWWDNIGLDDFRDELQEALIKENMDNISNGELTQLFYASCDEANEYPIFEMGEIVYIDFEKPVLSALKIINKYCHHDQEHYERQQGQLFLM